MHTEVSLPQAAARLGVSWPIAYSLAMRGELGKARQGDNGRWLVPEDGVAAYLLEHGSRATATPPLAG